MNQKDIEAVARAVAEKHYGKPIKDFQKYGELVIQTYLQSHPDQSERVKELEQKCAWKQEAYEYLLNDRNKMISERDQFSKAVERVKELEFNLSQCEDALSAARAVLGDEDRPFLDDGIKALKTERDQLRAELAAYSAQPFQIHLGRLMHSLPSDVIKKVSCHDLKRICDLYNSPETITPIDPPHEKIWQCPSCLIEIPRMEFDVVHNPCPNCYHHPLMKETFRIAPDQLSQPTTQGGDEKCSTPVQTADPTHPAVCPACNGVGTVYHGEDEQAVLVCGSCSGTGEASTPSGEIIEGGYAKKFIEETMCSVVPTPSGDPTHPADTCAKCGKSMRHNVPRLGSDGGFVHADTGKFECEPTPSGEWRDGERCGNCGGLGYLYVPNHEYFANPTWEKIVCPKCNGKGYCTSRPLPEKPAPETVPLKTSIKLPYKITAETMEEVAELGKIIEQYILGLNTRIDSLIKRK